MFYTEILSKTILSAFVGADAVLIAFCLWLAIKFTICRLQEYCEDKKEKSSDKKKQKILKEYGYCRKTEKISPCYVRFYYEKGNSKITCEDLIVMDLDMLKNRIEGDKSNDT